MTATDSFKSAFPRAPRAVIAQVQDTLPGRYSRGVRWLSMLAFGYVIFAYLNESVLHWVEAETDPNLCIGSFRAPLWLSHWTEYVVIVLFGIWRTLAEKNAYTRKRLGVLTAVVGVLWWLVPDYLHIAEPYLGQQPHTPIFPHLHMPGTLTFFLILLLVFLFGRRVVCGWGCPCVGIRELVGFPFRANTPRDEKSFRWRHLKWPFFALYMVIFALIVIPGAPDVSLLYKAFLGLIIVPYFLTMLLAPLIGNRSYCRFICPYGATFGVLNRIGFFGVALDRNKCNDCRRCEQACDMGVPIWKQGKEHGRVVSTEECMGCARCVLSCPTDALSIRDVRNALRPNLVQNASYLLKVPAQVAATPPRALPLSPTPTTRVRDWREAPRFDLATAQVQAARCLDCGVPGCRSGCPLHNRIPEWLSALAQGDVEQAAAISHSTSNLPEVCGRLCPQQRLCEGACTRVQDSGAVSIGALERFITDTALAQDWQPRTTTIPRNGKRIAIVGAGPAGLACADELNKAGCTVSVYDKQAQIGGLLNYGVPPFKMAKDVLARRHRLLTAAGIHFTLGVTVDEPLLRRLLDDHDAVFLGIGAQAPRAVAIDGQHLPGVYNAISYLAALNAHHLGDAVEPPDLAARQVLVLVLGGGDSAMDCARAAVRQGAASVTVAYRGNAQALRAMPREVDYATEEGVHLLFQHQPLSILGETRVTGVSFSVRDSAAPHHDHIACDTVILALGQQPEPPVWLAPLGVASDARGLIVVDNNGRTGHPAIYAGGDISNGPDLAVTAIAAGRRAAQGILANVLTQKKGQSLRIEPPSSGPAQSHTAM